MTLDKAIDNLERAIQFFDQVKNALPDERIAVGTDHRDWLESAARDVVKARLDNVSSE